MDRVSSRESAIEKDACKWAVRNGWMAVKLQDLGNTGWPDRTFIKNGKVLWVEFKAPGGRLSPKQRVRILAIRAHGGHVLVSDSVAEVTQWLLSHD